MSVFYPSRLLFLIMMLLFVFCLSFKVMAQDISVSIDNGEGINVAATDVNELDIEVETNSRDASAVISAPSAADPDVSSFFDAEDLVPQGEMAKTGPVKLDPATQPASRLMIVRKTHNADTKSAQLVSAERAMGLGRFSSAILMFDTLYAQSKTDSRVLMGRAVVLQNLGRFDEAMQMYESLSKVDPDNVTAKVNMLGLLATRYPAVALQRLLALYENNRSNVNLTAQIAITYAKTGNAAAALRYLGIAASMEPQNANHIFNMAIISDRAGEQDEAVSYYEQALELDTVHGAGRSIPRDSVYERLAQIR